MGKDHSTVIYSCKQVGDMIDVAEPNYIDAIVKWSKVFKSVMPLIVDTKEDVMKTTESNLLMSTLSSEDKMEIIDQIKERLLESHV